MAAGLSPTPGIEGLEKTKEIAINTLAALRENRPDMTPLDLGAEISLLMGLMFIDGFDEKLIGKYEPDEKKHGTHQTALICTTIGQVLGSIEEAGLEGLKMHMLKGLVRQADMKDILALLS